MLAPWTAGSGDPGHVHEVVVLLGAAKPVPLSGDDAAGESNPRGTLIVHPSILPDWRTRTAGMLDWGVLPPGLTLSSGWHFRVAL